MPVQILRQRRFVIRRTVTRNDDTVQRMAKSQWTQGINRPSLFVPDSYPLQRSGEGSHCPTSAVAEWHKVAIAIQTEVRVAYGGRIAQDALCRPDSLHITDYSTQSFIEYECQLAYNAYLKGEMKIVVLYNSVRVDKRKCPKILQNIGNHVPMKC